MKHFFFLSFCMLSISCFGQADTVALQPAHSPQDCFYIRLGVGYGFPYTGDVTGPTTGPFGVKSYTSGVNEVIGCGYMINKYIGIELNGAMFSPGKKYSYTGYAVDSVMQANYSIEANRNIQSLILLMPGVTLQTGGKKLNLYSRLSLVLPISNKLTTDEAFTNSAGSYAQTYTVDMRFTAGASAAIGISYALAYHVNFWMELNAISLSPYTKQTTLVSSTLNGTDNLSSYTTQQKTGTYAFSASYPAGTANPPSPTSTRPFSNIGVQAGISLQMADRHNDDVSPSSGPGYFYLKAGLGYAVPFANYASDYTPIYNGNFQSHYNYVPNSTNYSSGTQSFSEKRASFTAGLKGIVGAGYMFNKHLGVEVDADMGIVTKKYTLGQSWNDTSGAKNYYNSSYHSQLPILFTPCIVIQTGGQKVNVYSRIGLVLPTGNKITEEQSYIDEGSSGTSTTTYSTLFTLGYTGALGIKYSLTDKWQLWGEISILSYEPYLKEISYEGSGVSEAKFSDGSTSSLPYSSAGLQAGVSFRL